MKFKNCILINFVTDAGTDAHTDAHTDKPKAICPFIFSKAGGIKTDGGEKGSSEIHEPPLDPPLLT